MFILNCLLKKNIVFLCIFCGVPGSCIMCVVTLLKVHLK